MSHLLGPPEFFQKYSGRFFGKYRATVLPGEDPRKLGRVKVFQPEIYGDDASPWAWPCLAPGFSIPRQGDRVWVEFEMGLKEKPIITGKFYWEDDEIKDTDGSPVERLDFRLREPNPVAEHARGEIDGTDLDGTEKGMHGVPFSNFKGKYGDVLIIESKTTKQFIELDDTEGYERIQIMSKSGSHIEILPDGTVNIISSGRILEKSASRKEIVRGKDLKEVDGSSEGIYKNNVSNTIDGSFTQTVKRDITETGENKTLTLFGQLQEIVAALDIQGLNDVKIKSGANLGLGAGDSMTIGSGNFLTLLAAGALNSLPIPIPPHIGPSANLMNLIAQSGRFVAKSTDPTGLLSQYGILAQSQGTLTRTITPLAGEVGPAVMVGNLLLPLSPLPVPLVQEPVVLGLQLTLLLNALMAFLQSWLTDYTAHIHLGVTTGPGISGPAVTSPVTGPVLQAALTALQAIYLTPSSLKGNPLILSDVVHTSKI
jgi:hypothetical protein